MLKVAIETGYTKKIGGIDLYGSRLFMQNIFSTHDIELVRVSINFFNQTKQYFTEYNKIASDGTYTTIKKKYIPDIIRSRKGMANIYKYELLKKFITIPSEKISLIGNEKFENYMFLKQYQPFTSLLSSFFGNRTIQKSFKNKIVIKPIRANGGKGITLTTVSDLLKKRKKYEGLESLYIVQQYKDFTKGYPGICTSNHDVRFMFVGKKIIEITLRIPKKGDFRSNLGSGGSQYNLQKSTIPKDLLLLSKKIYKELNIEDKNIFSMDFAYCRKDKQRYLLEINASPGTWYYQTNKKTLKKICIGFINFFKNIINK